MATPAATATATATATPTSATSKSFFPIPSRSISPFLRFSPRTPSISLKSKTHPSSAPARSEIHPPSAFHGECFVVSDNIDTDQIIPAEYLTLVPSKPEEYKKLGSHAFSGLPAGLYPTPFIQSDTSNSKYSVIIAGANFGCGSSREHAPVAIGAAGTKAVVAESYARIFFRNSVATGEVYPLELESSGASKECKTGHVVTVDLEKSVLVNHTIGKEYRLKPIGDAGPVIEAGGIFAYARKTGMISGKN